MISKYKQEDISNHVKLFNKWLFKEPLPMDTPMEVLYSKGSTSIMDYNKHIKKVVIWTGPGWEKWNHNTVAKGMAGSETWATYLAREFVKLGYITTVYNDLLCEDGSGRGLDPVYDSDGKLLGNVTYRDHTVLLDDLRFEVVDYFISSRSSDPFNWNTHSVQRYVMVHDIWISSDSNYDTKSWAVQKFACLSEWHRDFVMQHHKLPPDKVFLTANGIDLSLYSDVDTVQKKNAMVYSSSPDRGLYQFLKMMPIIKERVPDFELYIAYGFYNWETAARSRNDVMSIRLIEKIKELIQQPGVVYLDRIPKTELAKYQKQAKVWLFPSWFTETFCCHENNNIYTKNGFKKITELNIKDEVLTHKNRFRNISKIMSRSYTGDLLGLILQNHTGSTSFFTPEHPVLMLPGDAIYKIRRNKYGDYTKETFEKFKIQPEWKPIGLLKPEDYVCLPTQNTDLPMNFYEPLKDLLSINRVKGKDIVSFKGLPTKIPMSKEFARFLGFYFAEGSYSTSTIKFSFNTKEKEYIKFIKKYLKDVFGYDSKDNIDGNSHVISCNNYILGILLKRLFGPEASQKDIPYFVFNQDKEFIKEFIKSSFQGDGCFGGNEYRIQLATMKGVMSLKMLMSRIGLHPSFRKDQAKGFEYYGLGISKSLWEELFKDSSYAVPKKRYKVFFEFEGDIYYRVKTIVKKHHSGRVYNLEVEEDNSYTSDFIAVHNCITGVENGASKNALLVPALAGLTTTLKDSAIFMSPEGLSRDDDYPPEFQRAFIEESVKLLTNEEYRKEWADKAYNKAITYTWGNVAQGWVDQFNK